MNPYHKINSVFKRDTTVRSHPFIFGEYADPAVEYLKDNMWRWTEKVDGTNIRVMWDGESVSFAGKSDRAEIPKHLLDALYDVIDITHAGNIFGETPACMYGEGFGYKIQGGIGQQYLGEDVGFYLFDIRIGDVWLSRESVEEIGQSLCIPTAKTISIGTIDSAIEYVRKGFASQFGTAQAEGLVLRPMVELLDRRGNRIITKTKTRDFKRIEGGGNKR